MHAGNMKHDLAVCGCRMTEATLMNKEMMAALEADGEKLRQLTGEDHGPVFLTDARFEICGHCNGSGVIGRRVSVYEHGCGFPHDDTEEEPCPECGGTGETETEVEPVTLAKSRDQLRSLVSDVEDIIASLDEADDTLASRLWPLRKGVDDTSE
jgi:hypothetical protein